MSYEESKLFSLLKKQDIDSLFLEATNYLCQTKSLFEEKEQLQQENEQLKSKYNQALNILSDFNLPCELEGFMDKNTDYCSLNCSMNDDVYKECWNRYIEQKLEQGGKE